MSTGRGQARRVGSPRRPRWIEHEHEHEHEHVHERSDQEVTMRTARFRSRIVQLALPLAVALTAVPAWAAEGAPPPAPTAAADAATPPPATPAEPAKPAEERAEITLDARIPTATRPDRWFHILGVYELHFNVISDEYSANDWLSWYMVKADFDVSKYDQLSLRADLEQRYVADPGEAGLYFGDLRFYYSRKFTIPIPGFPLPGKASVYLTAPTSRESRARSYLTMPTAQLTVAPSLGPVTLLVTGIYRYAFARYAESSEGGAPNERQTAGVAAQLVYVPVDWFAPSLYWESTWTDSYPTREGTSQGFRPDYRYEIAANFTVPLPEGWPTLDLSLAWAQGASVLSDGVYRTYFAKRDQSEVYFALNLTY
jgi:hypothetical protein